MTSGIFSRTVSISTPRESGPSSSAAGAANGQATKTQTLTAPEIRTDRLTLSGPFLRVGPATGLIGGGLTHPHLNKRCSRRTATNGRSASTRPHAAPLRDGLAVMAEVVGHPEWTSNCFGGRHADRRVRDRAGGVRHARDPHDSRL